MGVKILTEEDKTELQKQIDDLNVLLPRQKEEIVINVSVGKLLSNKNIWRDMSGMTCRYTNLIPVSDGDRFSYIGRGEGEYPNVLLFDENKNLIGYEYYGDLSKSCKLVTISKGASYVRFCDHTYNRTGEFTETGNLQFEVLYMPKLGEDREIVINGKDGGFFCKNNEWRITNGYSSKRTNPIPVYENDIFYYTGFSAWGNASVIWYDSNGKVISTEEYEEYTELKPPNGAVLVRFYSFAVSTFDKCILVVSYKTENKTIEYLQSMNYLWGKKYVACGDSFTAGDFSSKTDETWDSVTQEYKTYCWHIANRNRMTLINEAKSGSTMHNNGDSNAFCITRYKNIPTDVDYITLCFGLNETTATIGELTDTTDNTVIGAWNIVLEYLITNIPYAKIGIIIPDSWCSKAMRDALISVATYWGIPYLDLKGDTSVPLMIGGRYDNSNISSKARELRNNAFQISAEDSHPNAKAHEYRSTVIENFMRSL